MLRRRHVLHPISWWGKTVGYPAEKGGRFRTAKRPVSLFGKMGVKVGVCPCVLHERTYAMRPVFARVAGELGAADPRFCSKGP